MLANIPKYTHGGFVLKQFIWVIAATRARNFLLQKWLKIAIISGKIFL